MIMNETIPYALAVIGLTLGYLMWFCHTATVPGVKGPKTFPFFGQIFTVIWHSHRILDWMADNTRKFGKVWTFYVPTQSTFLVVTGTQNVKHILVDNFENYVKGSEFHSKFHELLGNGIFNTDGPGWKKQRKTAANIFSIGNFKDNMIVVFANHARLCMEKIATSAKSGTAIDMHDLYHRYTLDSIGTIAFGVQIDSLNGDVPFMIAFDYVQEIHSLRFLASAWQFQRYLLPSEWKARWYLRKLNSYAQDIIDARRAEFASSQSTADGRSDLLTLFMQRKDENGNPFSDEYLRDVIMNMTIAGRDTTAQALSWATYLLSLNPDVEAKMLAEIDRVVGGKTVDYDMFKKLEYTTAVFHEALRLYPSVPKDLVYCVHDDTLPDGTKVPAGTNVVWAPWVMGRDEDVYPNAEKFMPERWFDANGARKKMSPHEYIVFKAGPRLCLGQNMAEIEGTAALATIYSRYTFKLVEGHVVKYRNTVSLPMKYGLRMTVHERAGKQ